jgi:hypothetical protein
MASKEDRYKPFSAAPRAITDCHSYPSPPYPFSSHSYYRDSVTRFFVSAFFIKQLLLAPIVPGQVFFILSNISGVIRIRNPIPGVFITVNLNSLGKEFFSNMNLKLHIRWIKLIHSQFSEGLSLKR